MAKSRDIFTTGEVARICKVAPRTVSKWFDSGELGGYRIPGSKDRRIPQDELLVFMDKHGIPRNGLKSDKQRALIVTKGASNNAHLEKTLAENKFEVQSADSAFAEPLRGSGKDIIAPEEERSRPGKIRSMQIVPHIFLLFVAQNEV